MHAHKVGNVLQTEGPDVLTSCDEFLRVLELEREYIPDWCWGTL